MFYWRFNFEREILINCLFTQWKQIYIYWILDLEDEVQSIWNLQISGLQECKGNDILEVRRAGKKMWSCPNNLDLSLGGWSCLNLPPHKILWEGGLTSAQPHIGNSYKKTATTRHIIWLKWVSICSFHLISTLTKN